MEGTNMQPSGETEGVYLNTDYKGWKLKSRAAKTSQQLNIYLYTNKSNSTEEWKTQLATTIQKSKSDKNALANTRNWWADFWNRSFIFINNKNDEPLDIAIALQVGRNYQLFRYAWLQCVRRISHKV
jgi:hypothetical protein